MTTKGEIVNFLKSCRIRQLEEQQKIVDAVADLRFENRILVEALKEYSSSGWLSKNGAYSCNINSPWKTANEALKKTGHWE